MVSELRFETKKIRMADLGKESCVPDLLGELTMQNQLEFHLDERIWTRKKCLSISAEEHLYKRT